LGGVHLTGGKRTYPAAETLGFPSFSIPCSFQGLVFLRRCSGPTDICRFSQRVQEFSHTLTVTEN